MSDTTLRRLVADLPCHLPREVEDMYRWRDGAQGDAQFVWYHYFPPLEEAMSTYHRLTRSGFLHGDEFPIMDFEGEYYVVRCARQAEASSPVWNVFHNPERPVNYLSVTAFMQTAAEWFDRGAVRSSPSGALQEPNIKQLAAIHQHFNPGALFPYSLN